MALADIINVLEENEGRAIASDRDAWGNIAQRTAVDAGIDNRRLSFFADDQLFNQNAENAKQAFATPYYPNFGPNPPPSPSK